MGQQKTAPKPSRVYFAELVHPQHGVVALKRDRHIKSILGILNHPHLSIRIRAENAVIHRVPLRVSVNGLTGLRLAEVLEFFQQCTG